VLIYVLFAERRVEIVADRGIAARVSAAEWEAVCRAVEVEFRDGRFREGSLAAIAGVGDLLAQHFRPPRVIVTTQPNRPLLLQVLAACRSSCGPRPNGVPSARWQRCACWRFGRSWPGRARRLQRPVKIVEAPPPAPAPAPAPDRRGSLHRVVYDPAQGDLIGRVQTTIATMRTRSSISRAASTWVTRIGARQPRRRSWLPGEGRRIILPTAFILPHAPREGVVINIAAMRLLYFPTRKANEPQVIDTFPIGIGRVGFATPEGTTKVLRKAKDPIWRPGPGVRAEHAKDG
jgi:hypothetical protein